MGRSPCCDENGLKKGPWTPEEDQKLVNYIQKHGHGSWRALPKLAGLNRCGKSCRLRWTNYLRPDIKRGKFSQEEEQTILHLHSILGNKWSAIATHLSGRTDNEIKNFWNTHLKKRLIQMGFDPMTHQPRTDLLSTLPYLLALANNMTEIMDRHSLDEHALRLQAESIQLARLQQLQYLLQSTNTYSYIDQNAMTNMDAFNFLNSITNNVKDHNIIDPIMNCPQLDHNPASFSSSSQPLHHSSMEVSDFLDQQVSFSSKSCLNTDEQGQGTNFGTVIMGQGDHFGDDSPWSTLTPSPASSIPLNVTGTSNGDASTSTSSFGGTPSYNWPELFYEDPILHELS